MLTARTIRLPASVKDVLEKDLAGHVTFFCRAIARHGSLHIQAQTAPGPLIVTRELRKRSSGYVVLRGTSGHIGRKSVLRISELLRAEEIDYHSRFTPKRKLLRDVQIRYSVENILVAQNATADVIRIINAFCSTSAGPYNLTYFGPFDPNYRLRSTDPLEPNDIRKAGYRIGTALGNVVRLLRV